MPEQIQAPQLPQAPLAPQDARESHEFQHRGGDPSIKPPTQGFYTPFELHLAVKIEGIENKITNVQSSISTIKWFITITCAALITASGIFFNMLYGLNGTLNQTVKELEMLRSSQSSLAVMAAPARLDPVSPAETTVSPEPDSGPNGTEGTEGARGR